jgi:heme-degrading monooxygenase HmoA
MTTLALLANVILMNPFDLKTGQEEVFLQRWRAVAAYMQKQPGFVSARLHKGLEGSTWFNYAEWRSTEDFQKATQSDEFRKLTRDFPGEGRPVLYKVHTAVTP